MYRTGHMGINMILYAPILFVLVALDFIITGILGLVIMIYFASLPDMDLSHWFLKHRGFTHTYVFALIVGTVFGAFGLIISSAGMNAGILEQSTWNQSGLPVGAFFLGVYVIVGHIIGDIITPAGVRPFAKPRFIPNLPIFWDKQYSLSLVYAKNTLANGGFLLIGGLLIAIAFVSGAYLSSTIPVTEL